MEALHRLQVEPAIARALEEDWGYRDWTTDLCVSSARAAKAKLICKEDTVVSGVEVAEMVFDVVDPNLRIERLVANGERLPAGSKILIVSGSANSILKAERVALNFLGRMCGIASHTAKYVEKIATTKVQLLDTRKTTPGLRLFEKAATHTGGARNHRFGLSDGIMLKENHIRAAGSISNAMSALHESLPPTIKVEVETTCINEVEEALQAAADIIMLDNMSFSEMKRAVQLVDGRAILEASGNIQLENVAEVAATGVDFISTSSVITKARWADLSLLFDIDQ